jgi:F-type H+-transporting ATPase subunit beta
MDSTDGLSRGYEVVGTGNLSKCQLVQMFTVVYSMYGDAIDGLGNYQNRRKRNVYSQTSTKFEDLSTSSEVLFTVLK